MPGDAAAEELRAKMRPMQRNKLKPNKLILTKNNLENVEAYLTIKPKY